jgi:hypothetical protein
VLGKSEAGSKFISGRVSAVIIVMLLLFSGNILLDKILYWRGITGAQTLWNDFAIAALGGAALWFFLALQREREEMSRARERLVLTAELNHHLRNAFTIIANGVMLKNEADRLRMLDEAVRRIDHVLTELVPTANMQGKPRLFLQKTG